MTVTSLAPEPLRLGGADLIVHVDAAETGGALALVELRAPIGTATPPHIHRHEDQGVLVVEGVVAVTVDRGRRTLGAGRFLMLPRGVPHALEVVSPEARYLCVFTPAGHEDVLRRAAGEALSRDDLAAILATGGVELL
jgi:quercetin dioxygenase-like cupin family protein